MADQPSFQKLEASLLYCPTCRQAMPVRKRLLSIMAESNKFEYVCTRCTASCGEKIEPDDDPESRVLM